MHRVSTNLTILSCGLVLLGSSLARADGTNTLDTPATTSSTAAQAPKKDSTAPAKDKKATASAVDDQHADAVSSTSSKNATQAKTSTTSATRSTAMSAADAASTPSPAPAPTRNSGGATTTQVAAPPAAGVASTTQSKTATASATKTAARNPDNPDAGDAGDIRLGDLTSIGSSKLISHDTRIGLEAGVAKLGDAYYLTGALDFDLAIKRFALGISTPVNIPIYDPAEGAKLFPQGIKLRKQDYANAQDFARMIRYLTYGVKESGLYVNFSTLSSETIGHGGAVRNYVASIDLNEPKLSGEVDAKFKYGGFEAFVGDVLHPNQVLGGLAYLKPFGGSSNIMLQRLSFGLTYAGDLQAPLSLERNPSIPYGQPISASDYPVTTPDGSLSSKPCDVSAPCSSPQLTPAQTAQLHIVGASIETKVVRTYNADVKPYLDFNQMIVTGGGLPTKAEGYGFALGALGRFGFGEHGRHAIRAILEGRLFQNDYIPDYFDTFYQVQRYQYFGNSDDPAAAPTKLAYLLNQDSSLKVGFYAELQYALAGWFAVSAAYEDSTQVGGQNLILHLEVPTTEYLRFFGTLYRRGASTLNGEQPGLAGNTASDMIYFVGARIKALPILFFNVGAFQTWELDQNNTNNSYRNVTGLQIDAEVGYEFSRGTYVQQ